MHGCSRKSLNSRQPAAGKPFGPIVGAEAAGLSGGLIPIIGHPV